MPLPLSSTTMDTHRTIYTRFMHVSLKGKVPFPSQGHDSNADRYWVRNPTGPSESSLFLSLAFSSHLILPRRQSVTHEVLMSWAYIRSEIPTATLEASTFVYCLVFVGGCIIIGLFVPRGRYLRKVLERRKFLIHGPPRFEAGVDKRIQCKSALVHLHVPQTRSGGFASLACCFRAGAAGRQVYYGFSPNFVEWGKAHMTYFDEWMAQMEVLLDQEGVLYKGEAKRTFESDTKPWDFRISTLSMRSLRTRRVGVLFRYLSVHFRILF